MALLAQHECNEQLSAVVPGVVVRKLLTVNIGALSNALATAIGQAASPAQQVTASASTTPSTTEASSAR